MSERSQGAAPNMPPVGETVELLFPRGAAVWRGRGAVRVRAGFHVLDASPLAGGPVELEFRVEIAGPGKRYLAIFGDRTRGRPVDFAFDATFAGTRLGDPFAGVPDLGGPGGAVEITSGNPWRQPVIVNQWVRLEDTLRLLEPGAAGQLEVICRRALPLAAGEMAALARAKDSPVVAARLALELHRDDDALAALADRLLAEVRDGPAEHREHPLALLLALRAPLAVMRWRSLVDHPDPIVAQRAAAALRVAADAGSRGRD